MLTLGAVGVETLGVGLILPFIEIVSNPASIDDNRYLLWMFKASGATDYREFIVYFGVGFAVVFIVRSIYLGIVSYIQSLFLFGLYRSTSTNLLRSFLFRGYDYHLRHNSAEITRTIINDAGGLTSGVVQPAMTIITEAAIVIGLLSLLVMVKPVETIAAMTLFGGCVVLAHTLMKKRISNMADVSHHAYGEMLKWINQSTSSIREVMVMGREPYFFNRFSAYCRDYTNTAALFSVFQVLPRLMLEAFAVVGMMGLVTILVLRGQDLREIIPFLAMFAAATFRLMPSLSRIYTAAMQLRFAEPQLKAVTRNFNEATMAGIDMTLDIAGLKQFLAMETKTKTAPLLFKNDIRLDTASYVYQDANVAALIDIKLTIPRGASIGIVGPSGAGKSTLLGILLGLLEPTRGQLLIDGEDAFIEPEAWRQHIGFIPQEVLLLDDTIRNNVAFGLQEQEIDDAIVHQALEMASMTDVINGLPEGLDTIVGERGMRLSGGQRQRISIARALYHQPDVLIMDEATAALDNQTEKEITKAINLLGGKKTIIIVAHRLSTVQGCDHLYFLDKGAIVAEGSFEELCQLKGFQEKLLNDHPAIEEITS